jgi:ElaB/YqjD/DUF883 family membrane-anchored ribosome-binding protein
MGQLLDALNAVDADIAAANNKPASPVGESISDESMSAEQISSVIDEATESVIGAADRVAPQTSGVIQKPNSTIEAVTKLVRQAPLQALAVAFLVGIAVARRR